MSRADDLGVGLTVRVQVENNWGGGRVEEDGERRGQCQDPEEKWRIWSAGTAWGGSRG